MLTLPSGEVAAPSNPARGGLEITPKIDVWEEMGLPVSPGRDQSADIEKGRVGKKKKVEEEYDGHAF